MREGRTRRLAVLIVCGALATLLAWRLSVGMRDEAARSQATVRTIFEGRRSKTPDGEVIGSSDDPDIPMGDGVGMIASQGSDVISHTVPACVADAASDVLATYRDNGNCVLVNAGYLDLMGGTWGCTVQGAGWVELCLVGPDGDDGTSVVTTVRMDAGDWGDGLGWGDG